MRRIASKSLREGSQMTDVDKQRLIEMIRHIVAGLDGVRRDLSGLGGNPVEAQEAADGLRQLEYKLMSELSPPEHAVRL